VAGAPSFFGANPAEVREGPRKGLRALGAEEDLGRAVIQSLAAANLLQQEHNISVEVVDLRSIRPLDIDTVLASVRKTHRVLVVEEQKPFCGVGAQLAYMIQSEAFDELDGPIARLCTIDAPAIYSPPAEAEQLPNPQRILKAAIEALD